MFESVFEGIQFVIFSVNILFIFVRVGGFSKLKEKIHEAFDMKKQDDLKIRTLDQQRTIMENLVIGFFIGVVL